MNAPDAKVTVSQSTLLRVGGVLAFSWLLWAANSTWYIAGGFVHPLGAILSVFLYGLFFLYGFLTLQATLPKNYAAYVIAGMAIGLVVRTFVLTSVLRPGIETDGLAISLSAAQAVVAGHDPYAMDHIGAFSQYHLSPEFNTPRIDGSVVSSVTYPALSFLLYVIPVITGMDPRWISVGAFILCMIVLAAMSPPSLRTIVPLVLFVDPNFINYILGLQDISYVPLVAGAAYFWTEMPVLAGVLLGLGACVKQEPWLAGPFFALGVYLSRTTSDRLNATVRAAGAAAIAFLVPNLPFIVENPGAWLRGALDPFGGQNVEWGSGLISVFLATGTSVPRWVLTATAAVIYIVLFALVWRTWPKLRHAAWLVPGLSLFFAPRSLENYYLYLAPICLASWLGQTEGAMAFKAALVQRWQGSQLLKLLAAGALPIVLAGCAHPFASVSVEQLVDSRESGFTDKLVVDVHNQSSAPLTPTYLVIVGGTKQYLWKCERACAPIAAGSTRRAVIGSAGYAAAVPDGTGAAVVVVSSKTGDEAESAGVAVPETTLHLGNACLCAPADLSYSVPAGWNVNLADVASGVVHYDAGTSLGSITLTLTPGGLRMWRYERVDTTFVPFERPVEVGVSKDVLYEGGLSPTQYAGVAVDDGYGHTELFVWGPGARTQAYQGPGGVIIVEPAATQRYLVVDARRFLTVSHLVPSPSYTLSFVIGAMQPKATLSATFTGFHVSAVENRLPPPPQQPGG